MNLKRTIENSLLVACTLVCIAFLDHINKKEREASQSERQKAGIPIDASDAYIRSKIAEEVIHQVQGRLICDEATFTPIQFQTEYSSIEMHRVGLWDGKSLQKLVVDVNDGPYVTEYGVDFAPKSPYKPGELYRRICADSGKQVRLSVFSPSTLNNPTDADKTANNRILDQLKP